MSANGKPTLWQIKISHYSEKIRWALDLKSVEHERKAPPPGPHMAFALIKSRGASKTFPLLDLDGETYSDSTEIIAALERRWPEPPLYPEDPAKRTRALALEDFFDEQVGPYTRLLAWNTIVSDPPTARKLIEDSMVGPLKAGSRFTAPVAAGFLQLRYGVKSADRASEARAKIEAGFDRLEAELDGNEYLVGNRFTVADLTAAALFYPTVLPPEGPPLPEPPPAYAEIRAALEDRPGFKWVEEMFHRHRKRGAAKAPAGATSAA
ncbi:MAG: glutathione S-transferase family protein [Solirubrobacterales bacterium]